MLAKPTDCLPTVFSYLPTYLFIFLLIYLLLFLLLLPDPSGFFLVAFCLGLEVSFLGVECVTGRWIQKGEDSDSSTGSGSGGEGLSNPFEELLLMLTRSSYSSSEEDRLPVSLACSSYLLFVLSSTFCRDLGVDVGVARFWRLSTAHCSIETISSGIGFARVGSANLVAGISSGRAVSGWDTSGCAARVGVISITFGAGSAHCYCGPVGWRRALISLNNFSILAL